MLVAAATPRCSTIAARFATSGLGCGTDMHRTRPAHLLDPRHAATPAASARAAMVGSGVREKTPRCVQNPAASTPFSIVIVPVPRSSPTTRTCRRRPRRPARRASP